MSPIGENEFLFILRGLKWTVLLAIIGFVGGGVFGILIALARTSRNRTARIATSGYIALFQGTPLLMQLFVVYYGVALLGIDVNAWLAVAIAFTLHASAFLGGDLARLHRKPFRKVRAKPQTRSASNYVSRMRDVILPQALKISMPATIGFLVQLIKGTSLAAIVGFIELTRAGQIISNQTYRPLLVFGVVGVIYFIICWPLSHLGSGLEKRMAKAVR